MLIHKSWTVAALLLLAMPASAMNPGDKLKVRRDALDTADRMSMQTRGGGGKGDGRSIVPLQDASILIVVNAPINWQIPAPLEAALEALPRDVAFWNVQTMGAFDTSILQMNWTAVLLFADGTGEFPTRAYDGGPWSQYVINGGNLFYSDQDYFWSNDEPWLPAFAPGDFAWDAFGIASGTNEAYPPVTSYSGVEGDSITGDFANDPYWTNLSVTFNWEDYVNPAPGAVTDFYNVSQHQPAGLSFVNSYGGRTVFFSFNSLAAIQQQGNDWVMTGQFSTLVANLIDFFSYSPVSLLDLISHTPVVPAIGGVIYYDIHVTNLTETLFPLLTYWTQATLPNGLVISPLVQVIFSMPPHMDLTLLNFGQAVPLFAPPGAYTFTASIGFYPFVQARDSFMFYKTLTAAPQGTAAEPGPADWAALGTWTVDDGTEPGPVRSGSPAEFLLGPACPNPFNAATTISVNLPRTADLTLAVYNTAGERVALLQHGPAAAGVHDFSFDGSSLASGVYFVRANVPGQSDSVRKIVLMK